MYAYIHTHIYKYSITHNQYTSFPQIGQYFCPLVNGFFLEYLPIIYKLGSYGLAFILVGGILVFSMFWSYYRRNKEKREKTLIVAKKREEFNVEWFKHQYYDLGKSIQDIANELDESVISVRKRLEDLENSEDFALHNNNRNIGLT